MSSVLPCLIPSAERGPTERFGDPLVESYLEFLTARCRPNSVLAPMLGRPVLSADERSTGGANRPIGMRRRQKVGMPTDQLPRIAFPLEPRPNALNRRGLRGPQRVRARRSWTHAIPM